MVTRRFAENQADEHTRLVRAIIEAAAWCDEPLNRERLADLLSDSHYLNLPSRVLTPALLGRFDCGHGRVEPVRDFCVFHRGEASVPTVAKALALQRALGAAGLLPAAAQDPQLPRRLFREDLFRECLASQPHLHEITTPSDLRGVVRPIG